jgi:hypothetical protein
MTSIGAASGAPDTVRCLGQGTNELATLGFSERHSDIIHWTVRCAPDCVRWANGTTVTCVQQSTAKVNSARSEVRAAMSGRTGYVWCSYKTKEFNGQSLQTPTSIWRGTHRIVNNAMSGAPPNCPVRHQQPTTRKWLEAINTPNHLHSNHPSFLN